MDTELSAVVAEIEWVLDAHLRCLAGPGPEWLTWSPALQGANTPSAILGHTLGVTAAFVLGVAGDEPWTRDRIAEFATSFPGRNEAEAAVSRLRQQLDAFAARTDLDLGELVLPDERAWGSPPDGAMSRRRVLLEALRHASIHLGEMRFTRSLFDEARQL